jgi:hypothetical protein
MASTSSTPTVRQLKARAKAAGVKRWYRLNRAALLVALGLPADDPRTVKALRAEARALKVRGWYRLNRADLLKALAQATPATVVEAPRPGYAKSVAYAVSIDFRDIDLGEPLLGKDGSVHYFGGKVNGTITWR